MEKNIETTRKNSSRGLRILMLLLTTMIVKAQDSTLVYIDTLMSSSIQINLAEIPDNSLRQTIDSISRPMTVDERSFISSYLLANHTAYITNWGKPGELFPDAQTFNSKDTFNITLIEGDEVFHMNKFQSFNYAYGPRWGRMHRGWDLQMDTGDSLRSAFNGIVRYAEYNHGGYGNCVVIRHLSGIETLYAHLSKLDCKSGDFLLAGEYFGLSGSTGRSSGPHLHWEFRYSGQSFDAMTAIDTSDFTLKADRLQLLGVQLNDPPEYVILKSATYHKVKRGETLGHIARKYHTSVSSLVRKNKLKNPDKLKIGQRLRIR